MKRSISIFFQVVIFLLTSVLVIGLTYIVARPYLIGDNFWGNDTYSFFAVVDWVNKYFPKAPFWYPVSGGGVSIISAYPTLAAYLVALISRITPFDLIQSFRLFGFATVPFLSLGVFLLVLTRLTSIKSGVIRAVLGLVAALFVVVSPNSWVWLTRWGFYAESSSYLFIPLAILFFDLFIDNVLQDKKGRGFKVGLLGTVIFTYLSFMSHFLALASLVVFYAVYVLIRILLIKKDKVRIFKKLLIQGLILAIFFVGIALSKLYSYQFYTSQVAIGGFAGYGRRVWQELLNNTLPLEMFLSLQRPTIIMDPHALIFDMRFPLFVWILFFLGLIVSFKKSNKVFAFSVYGILGLILSTVLPLKYFLSGIPVIGSIAGLMQDRGYLVIARVIVPVVAVYGSYMVWEVFIKIKSISVILALALISGLVFKLYYKPYDYKFMLGTGAFNGVLDLRDIWGKSTYTAGFLYGPLYDVLDKNPEYKTADFYLMRDLCLKAPMSLIRENSVCGEYLENKELPLPSISNLNKAEQECKQLVVYDEEHMFCNAFYIPLKDQLKFSNWPKFEVSSSISQKEKEVEEVFKDIPKDNKFRYDMSGFAGNVIMATPIFRSNSSLQLYINTASLIYNSWNYQGQVMYSPSNNYQKEGVLTQLGKWFGLEYIYLKGNDLEPIDYWKTDSNWQDLGNWKKFGQPTGLATLSDKPKVLLVTDSKRGLVDQFFRFATQGGLDYETADLIIGEEQVDFYSAKQLSNYDAIIMRGYGYKNKNNAYKLLDNYVKNGGLLIFDTGWQYEVPDFEIKNAPEFMPFGSLGWKNLGTNYSFSEENFGDLKYSGGSWGVSSPSGLKSWAKPILTYGDTPLALEGEYGKGKVIWYGFNIVAHSIAKDSQAEAMFFGKILEKNLSPKTFETSIVYNRISPDKIEFNLNGSDAVVDNQIYFRESYFPYWKASDGVMVEKSGPGFMLLTVPEDFSGTKIVLELKVGILQKIICFISTTFLIMFFVYLVKPSIFEKFRLPRLNLKINFPFGNTSKNEDEHY